MMARMAWAGVWLAISGYSQAQPVQVLAGDKFKNVTALKEMPAEHMGKVMNIMSEALGVSCTHCHVGYDFAREDANRKSAARKMIEMTLEINNVHFGGKTVVTCMTCHQGQPEPVDATVSATRLSAAVRQTKQASDEPSRATSRGEKNLTADNILNKYVAALGGQSALEALGQHKFQARRMEPNGKVELEEILMTPVSWEQSTIYSSKAQPTPTAGQSQKNSEPPTLAAGQIIVVERWSEDRVEKRSGKQLIELKTDEATQIKIEAHVMLGRLPKLFNNWKVLDANRIGEKEMNVLGAEENRLSHRFYFDAQSGLLRRRETLLPTVLGAYVIEVNYDDYQTIRGRTVPTKAQFRMPSVSWERVMDF